MRDFRKRISGLIVLATMLGGGSLSVLLPALAAPPQAGDASERTGRPHPLIGTDPVVRQFLAQAASQAPAATPSCARCHESQVAARNAGSHKAINCETCHGPQAKHIASDGKEKPAKPAVIPLCLNCHEKDPTKPVGRPQVDKAEHYNGTTCSDCHLPHAPKM
jgi:cytochrome c553